MKKVVVITSGGLDSTVLLHYHVDNGDAVRTLAIDYGQRHVRELTCARQIAQNIHVPFHIVDMSGLRDALPGSSQTDARVPVPQGHYTEESMKATVVPNRNMILLAVAIGHAIANGFDAVSYAAHSGDHAIYPDCREEFVQAMEQAAKLCDWKPIEILRPFIHKTKSDIVTIGHCLDVPFGKTYSCYEGREEHCGVCGTCFERREAFFLADVKDPTKYEDKRPFSEVADWMERQKKLKKSVDKLGR